ncbi:MAG: T9SS type A sorting domain-containing protein [Ignavibacteriaceae bacterium]|nr:T9SS type A sorting domain-containing protein [Ignavibacteriaceae bacterium]
MKKVKLISLILFSLFFIISVNAEEFICLPYPNPFNPDARLTVNIAEDSEYKITVMNLLGEEVKQLHTGYLGKGKHEFQIEMGEFSSGVYFINMQGRSGLQIIKINLLK